MNDYEFADFYIGRGHDARWIGSLEGVASPRALAETEYGSDVLGCQTASDFDAWARQVMDDSGCPSTPSDQRPNRGWPWPYSSSRPTQWTYAFDHGAVWVLAHTSDAWRRIPSDYLCAVYDPTCHAEPFTSLPRMLDNDTNGPIPVDREYGPEFARTCRWTLRQTASAVLTDLITLSHTDFQPSAIWKMRFEVDGDDERRHLGITLRDATLYAVDEEEYGELATAIHRITDCYNYSSLSAPDDRRFDVSLTFTSTRPQHA
ncbi:hypothetical protein NLX83_15700 [Allokutzneria sp. A3M-2-11 16]|uniref:hypothetical protein n=1 Tax=Allokutzneria sp. A3M-2-11 16 TaxID=2962043 RepID=UPI0020B82728|nr:hypothetical protein [Allokutzneria sp. A3M-2-11 16]MCP3800712.1 hypothetical protein [Allokutzneria sp. A3M-2-11 16]